MTGTAAMGHTVQAIVEVVRNYNPGDGRNKEPYLPPMPNLFGKKKQHTNTKGDQGGFAVMMFPVAMRQSMQANEKSQCNHGILKQTVVDDVDAEYGQAASKQG